MPGAASLAAREYYAHPRNAFWPVMARLFGVESTAPYAVRVARLMDARVAVWDVLAACDRSGSLDAAIDVNGLVVNDFARFLVEHPKINAVFFNGQTAARLFIQHVFATARQLSLATLPSTSPAHAARSVAQKMDAWRVIHTAVADGKDSAA